MENVIIRETSSEMRAIARKALRGNWKAVVFAMAVYYLLMITAPLLMDELFPGTVLSQMDELTGEPVTLPIISTLYTIILTGPLTAGMASYCLYFFRNRETHPGRLFDGFEYFLKSVILTILVGVYVFLWTLLFIVPGIIAGFRYSQAFYILADHPEYSASQCIRLSKECMKGNKGKLFVLELSFIGWALLAGLAAIPLAFVSLNGMVYLIADFVVSIPNFFYMAYNGIACIVFYELATGNLMARPRAEAFAQAAAQTSMETSAIPTFVEPPVEGESPVNPVEPQQEPTENNDEFNF